MTDASRAAAFARRHGWRCGAPCAGASLALNSIRLRRPVPAYLCAFAIFAMPIGAFAQGEADTYSVYEDADAHAACDSKTLPGLGYTILQVVPNTKGKDCYWKRNAKPAPSQSTGASDTKTLIAAARARQQTAIREIETARANGWPMFWRHFNGCGGDAACEAEVIRARITIEQELDARAAQTNQRFRDEMEDLLHAQIRPEEPAETTIRP